MKTFQMNNAGVSAELRLGIAGFTYTDLYKFERLKELLDVFDVEVAEANPELFAAWDDYRNHPEKPRTEPEISALLVAMAAHVSRFLTALFGIANEAEALAAATADQSPVFRFKIDFVRRRVIPNLKKIALPADLKALETEIKQLQNQAMEKTGYPLDDELATAMAAVDLMQAERSGAPSPALESLKQWSAAHLHDPAFRHWVSFRFPETIDHFNLVAVQHSNAQIPEESIGPDHRLRRRDGFGLTDERMKPREVMSEIHYCILCHERDKDSCSKGIKAADGQVTVNALEIPLAGCPLDEKISEMHYMRKNSDAIGALALVMLSNPMCPGTGHRICNDCMKACIYQKQDPVNIPQIETAVLTDTLNLPWGVEVYGLLTRWNPLNIRRPYALPYNGKNVLVVGMGPAGYTLAHYLINEGFGVVGVDGLKIEPLGEELAGTPDKPPKPVHSWSEIYRSLDDRVLEGFGGVSEYGITVRWDKNFLTLLHLTLSRRDMLRIYGGVRFGGTLTIEDAWKKRFHHIAMAAGAGRPTIIDLKNNLANGIRKASDFLMALQLTGAFKRSALPNLQVRLPALVIGGGLTAIDTATELFAYYPVQVEKTLERYEKLVGEIGRDAVLSQFNAYEREVLSEFLKHGAAIRAERTRASAADEKPNFVPLVRSWGGVSIAYRKTLIDSPAYRLNHEEVIKALEEGIAFIENLNPEEAIVDDANNLTAVRFKAKDRTVELPARSMMVAAGTTPNISYGKEHAGTFQLDKNRKFFAPHNVRRNDDGSFALEPAPDNTVGFFTSYNKDGRFVTYYGDNHPIYAGN